MPRAGFEPEISTFEQPKTVLVSERSAIEIGLLLYMGVNPDLSSWRKNDVEEENICTEERENVGRMEKIT
jgi:hypothetical protein